MTTNRRSMIPIVAAGFFVLSLVPIFTAAAQQREETTDDDGVQFFLRCKRLLRLYSLTNEEFVSHPDRWEAVICNDSFRLLGYAYEDTGRLPPGYKEALLIWYGNNQTLVDIDVCSLDHRHCPTQIAELYRRYDEELPYGWFGLLHEYDGLMS